MFDKSVEIGKRIGDYNKIAEVISSSSWSLEVATDWNGALSRSLRALEYCTKTDSDFVWGITYSNLVRLYCILEDFDCAKKYFEKMEALPKVVHDTAFVRFAQQERSFGVLKTQEMIQ